MTTRAPAVTPAQIRRALARGPSAVLRLQRWAARHGWGFSLFDESPRLPSGPHVAGLGP